MALAAAWADGQISLNEVNSVKEILVRLPSSSGQAGPQLTAREFAMLEMYARARWTNCRPLNGRRPIVSWRSAR
jgi:hypothetical protein